MKIFIGLFLAATLAGWPLISNAAEQATPLPFHELPVASISPTVPWARPLAGGPIRVLAIAPYGTMGDIAALRDFIEVELDTAAVWDRNHLGFDPQFPEPSFPDASQESVEKRLLRLLEKRRFDVIILGQCDPRIFPELVQQRIMDHVGAGTGLIVTGADSGAGSPLADWLRNLPLLEDPPVLTHGVGPLGIPGAERDALVSCHAAGEGRVARLRFQHEPSPRHCLVPVPQNPFDVVYEHEANAFALVCKALLWTAGRDPRIAVSHLVDVAPKGPDDEEIPPGYPAEFIESVRKNAFSQPIRPFILQLDAPAEDACEVAYQIRHPGASLPALIVTTNTLLAKGASYYPLDIIAAPGDYIVDLWLRNRKGVLAWHTEVVTVPGWPQLRDINVTQEGKKAVWLHPNDHLDVSADVPPLSMLTSADDATIYVRASDSFGRQVASVSQPVGPKGGGVALRLEFADLFAPLVQVEIFAVPSALANETTFLSQAARQVFYFPVRLPEPAREPEVIVSAPGPFDYAAIRQLNRLRTAIGASALHAPLNADSLLASSKAGLNRIAQLGTLDQGRVGPGPVRIPCLSAPDYQQAEADAIASGVLEAWAGGAPFYSLGAGCALTDTESDVCQSPACLARFRDYLQHSYASLEALNQAWGESFASWEAIVPPPLDQCQARQVWAPWLDFRRAMDWVFAEAHNRGRNAVHAVDGAGRVGFQTLYNHVTPMTGYDWRLLCDATDFLTVPPESLAMRRLQSFDGTRPSGGIVLGYETVRANPGLAQWSAWNTLFHQLAAVWIEQPFGMGARSLISPLGEPEPGLTALGEATTRIQEGVGTLLLNATPHPSGIAFVDSPATRYLDYADPGVTRTAAAAEAALAETVNRLGFPAGVRPLENIGEQGLNGINTLILSCIRALSDEEIAVLKIFHDNNGLIVTDGRPGQLDGHGAPRFTVALPYLHPLNPGKSEEESALWTNRPVWVSQLSSTAAGDEAILAGLLARAGNEPFLPVQLPDKQQGAVARFQYTYGAATLAAFLPSPDMDTAARRSSMKFPDKHFAFDLLHPMETMPRGRMQWTATPGEPALFAILPYRVERLLVEAPEIAVAGQRAVVRMLLDTGEATPGTHLILLQLEGPDGEELLHYRQHVLMEGGIAETFIPLAENEIPGAYLLSICDILTQERVLYPIQIES